MKSRKAPTVISPYTGAPSGKYPRAALAASGSSMTSWPQMLAVPAVGVMNPASMRMVVVLPAPLGPRKPSTSPGLTSKLTSSTAVSAS